MKGPCEDQRMFKGSEPFSNHVNKQQCVHKLTDQWTDQLALASLFALTKLQGVSDIRLGYEVF